jgi:2-succinyl-6-hydroxy-2,4-cyclohexadiene-1-carboxylate synthase
VLAFEVDGGGPRLVLVHGFTQTRAHWRRVAGELAADHEVVRVDAPGHGGSAPLGADLEEGAGLLAVTGGRGTYIGYSMGGRLCLHVALARPELVAGLVLVGATAGIEDPDERRRRIAADELLARRLEDHGVDAFLQGWLAQPLFAGLDDGAADVDARRANTVAGLAASLRLAGTGAQEALWERLGELAMPVLVVAGEDDERFSALARRLGEAVGHNAEVAVVAGAGHSVHLEAPSAFLDTLRPWLARHGL